MRKITILMPHRFMLSSLAIPLDAFKGAGVYWNILNDREPEPLFEVKTVSIDGNPVQTYDGLELKPDGSIQDVKDSETILIPPSDASEALRPEEVEWIMTAHARGAHIASICLGAFLLAKTGLLDGKTATTHWGYVNRFRKEFPAVRLKPDKIITDEGNMFCTGGANAGGDLSLYLIAKYVSWEVAHQTARVMLMDADRISQSPYSTFRFDKSHGDKQILDIQFWLEDNFSEDVTVEQLAEKVGMSRRTFERRFKDITGDSPRRCIQRIRVEKAKRFLELGGKTFDEITYLVGYEDSSTFSRVFKKSTGLTPNLYRRKYNQTC
ncbi:GlxA family transcriptional regulator [Desulfovibrio sp. JC010]|uniref:GlxA family transcriptional regulator n=1 Tax=Desulfovibrio sp. JC010 TaxID=2593641 RepID=UPI0013D1F40A|nr:GlxA family transcriptional regulator [Desulfovibrio sp. JC010]